jgi:hypothetical protein
MPGGIAPGDAVSALGSLGVVDPWVAELGLSGYTDSLPPPVSWGQLENNAELACSRVPVVDRLQWEVMAMVGRDILHPIWVS